MTAPSDVLTGLPGEPLIREGMEHLAQGRVSVPACLVVIALPRLHRAGLAQHLFAGAFADPELRLYRMLRGEGGDAYARYNALLRQLISFERALDQRSPQKPLDRRL